jgi:hypothetical protein
MSNVWRLEVDALTGSEHVKNSIDIQFTGTGVGTPPGIDDVICEAYKNFLQSIYFPDTELVASALRGIFYKQGPPPHPEHPPIHNEVISRVGTGNTTWGGAHNSNFLDDGVCIYVKKATTGGRSGKQFIRRILTEADIKSTLAGVWEFDNHAGGFQQSVFQAQVTTFLADFFGPTPVSGNYAFAVTHLEGIKDTDTRTPYATNLTAYTAIRPVYNTPNR